MVEDARNLARRNCLERFQVHHHSGTLVNPPAAGSGRQQPLSLRPLAIRRRNHHGKAETSFSSSLPTFPKGGGRCRCLQCPRPRARSRYGTQPAFSSEPLSATMIFPAILMPLPCWSREPMQPAMLCSSFLAGTITETRGGLLGGATISPSLEPKIRYYISQTP